MGHSHTKWRVARPQEKPADRAARPVSGAVCQVCGGVKPTLSPVARLGRVQVLAAPGSETTLLPLVQPLLAALQLLLRSMTVVEPCRLYEGAVWDLLSDWGALQITLGRHLAQWHHPSRGGALQPLALLECTLHKAHLCGCCRPSGIMMCVVALVAHHDAHPRTCL